MKKMKSKLLITSMLLISTSVYAQPPTPSAGNTSTINKPTSLQQAKSQAQAAKPQAQAAKSQAQTAKSQALTAKIVDKGLAVQASIAVKKIPTFTNEPTSSR